MKRTIQTSARKDNSGNQLSTNQLKTLFEAHLEFINSITFIYNNMLSGSENKPPTICLLETTETIFIITVNVDPLAQLKIIDTNLEIMSVYLHENLFKSAAQKLTDIYGLLNITTTQDLPK
jgi:hypothetical protein